MVHICADSGYSVNSLTNIWVQMGRNKKNNPQVSYCRNSTEILSRTVTTSPTNIITMVTRLLPLWCGFNESLLSDIWAAIQRGWPRAVTLDFV